MRRLLWLTALSLVACDLIAQATATIVVGGLVAATPELRYMGYFDVTSQVTANVWVGERASGTSTEAPTPVSGADVALAFGGKSVRLTESSAERGVYATTSVDDAALTTVTSERVREAVAELPPAQRQALELAYFKGHTYRQVADLLGIPEGTAKSRLRLALQRIAEALEPEVTEQWA